MSGNIPEIIRLALKFSYGVIYCQIKQKLLRYIYDWFFMYAAIYSNYKVYPALIYPKIALNCHAIRQYLRQEWGAD